MIRELIEYCLTPASKEAKKNGYLYEAMAFESRARRNQKHWKPHWTFCQQMVQDFVQSHPEAKSIAILGSGCLFEIPKEFLAERKLKIILVDQVFPRSVRAWAQKQQISVSLQEADLSKEFPSLNCDLLLSSNLLSQLSLPKANQQYRKEIELQHFEHIRKSGIPNLGWTDVERLYLHRETQEILESDATVLSPLPKTLHEWKWNLAPAPEWHRHVDLVLRMKSFVC